MAQSPPPALRRVRGATATVVTLVVLGLVASIVWTLTHQPSSAALPWTRTPVSQADADPDTYAAALLGAVNAERRHAHLAPLVPATCAAPVAARRADLLIGQRPEHAPLDEVRQACPGAVVVRENLSRAAVEPPAAVADWMASSQQRAELLDPALTLTAVACTHDADRMLCVQLLLGTG